MTPDTRGLSAQTPEQAATLIDSVAKNYTPGGSAHYALSMGAAALRQTKTCGTCAHFTPWFPKGVTANGPETRGDCRHRAYLGRRNGQSSDDGCLKGWTPKAPPVAEGETTR